MRDNYLLVSHISAYFLSTDIEIFCIKQSFQNYTASKHGTYKEYLSPVEKADFSAFQNNKDDESF